MESNNENNNNNGNRKNDDDNRRGMRAGLFVGATILLIFIIALLSNAVRSSMTEKISFNEFIDMVEEGRVSEVTFSGSSIEITVKTDEKADDMYRNIFGAQHTVTYYTGYIEYDRLVQMLLDADVDIYTETGSMAATLISIFVSYVLPIAIVWIFFYFLMRRSGGLGGLTNVGRSNAKMYVQKETGVTFRDVAGQDEAKESLVEIVDFLPNPEKYTRIGAKLPKGALLVGPPGTGKTLLARAVAGEANVPFFSLSGSAFVEMFVGVGASRVRDLFKQAQQQAPCIVFIDEIDAIGKSRDNQFGGNDEREQTLNQLLAEMDGFDSSKGVFILAATNRPEVLDPALLRPGRFDRQVTVDRPDVKGREQILRVHSENKPLDEGVDYTLEFRDAYGNLLKNGGVPVNAYIYITLIGKGKYTGTYQVSAYTRDPYALSSLYLYSTIVDLQEDGTFEEPVFQFY